MATHGGLMMARSTLIPLRNRLSQKIPRHMTLKEMEPRKPAAKRTIVTSSQKTWTRQCPQRLSRQIA